MNTAVMLVLARSLGKEGFGFFSYAIVYTGLFALIADLGMQSILVRELSRSKWNSGEVIGIAIMIKAGLSLFAVVLSIIFAFILGFPQDLFVVITILSFNILVTSKLSTFRVVFEAPYQSALRMEVPVLIHFADSLVLVGLIIWLAMSDAGLGTLAAGYVIASVPGTLLIVYFAAREFHTSFKFRKELVRYLILESLPLWFYSILMTLAAGIDTILLREFWDEGTVGLYSVALRLTLPWMFIPNGIVVSIFPSLSRFHETSSDNIKSIFRLALKILLLFGLTLAIFTNFWGRDLINFLFSQEFGDSSGALSILMWSQAIFFLNFFFTATLTSLNYQKSTFFAAAMILLTSGLSNLILIPYFSLEGAAIARLISAAVGFLILLVALRRVLEIRFGSVVPRVALFALLFLSGVTFLNNFDPIISLPASAGYFVLLIIITRFFDRSEWSVFRAAIPLRRS